VAGLVEGREVAAGRPAAPAEAEAAPPPARRRRTPGVWGQYMEFATVGIFNAVVDLGVLNLLLWLWPTTSRVGLTIENSLAVALAITNSYLWNTRWTFRRQADGSMRQLVLFVAQSLLNIGINDVALLATAGRVRQLHLGPAWVSVNLSKGVAMAFASSTSFLIMRLFVFRPRNR
jgi:putative flippase GtrA